MDNSPDVIVVGGGPSGAAAALQLLIDGLSVTLLEKGEYADSRIGEHLNPSGFRYLHEIDALSIATSPAHIEPLSFLSVWGSDELLEFDYLFSPDGGGRHLDRPAFEIALVDLVRKRGGQVILNAKVRRIQQLDETCQVDLVRPDSNLSCAFVVDATGRSATVAKSCSASVIYFDHLVGCASLHTAQDSIHMGAIVEAIEFGWWYIARLPSEKAISIFFTDVDIMRKFGLKPKEFWAKMLIESKVAKTKVNIKTREAFKVLDARSQRLDACIGDRWLAVGDAALAFDPLSSSGIVNGIRSGIEGAHSVSTFLGNGLNTVFQDYMGEINDCFNEYLRSRYIYYMRENRWPESDFWSRRHMDLSDRNTVWLAPNTLLKVPGKRKQELIQKLSQALDLSGVEIQFGHYVTAEEFASKIQKLCSLSDMQIIYLLQNLVWTGCVEIK